LNAIKKAVYRPLLAITLLASFGCASAPPVFSNLNQGRFKAKVLVRSSKEGKAQIVNADVRAINNEKMRIDVTSPVLTHLASLTLKGQELTFIVIPDKVGYRGQTGRNALAPILKVPIDPILLYNVFFDQPVQNKNWTCTDDAKGLLAECKELRGSLKIKWVSRDREKRTIEITHATATMQINIYDYEKDADLSDAKFDLKVPDSFKVIKI
jgi:hypothetical protein